MVNKIEREIVEGLAVVPILDAHTHMDAAHLSARGLHDVLLYHMVISDLVSAGCPSRTRLSAEPDQAEAWARLEEALPYLLHIQNTSIFWGVRIILKELYGWEESITAANWQRLDGMIRERAGDPTWPRQVMKKAGIRRTCTELWRGREGQADDLLQYSLEWAFFSRAQWGVNDIPLYELERAWNHPHPGAPLPVTLGERSQLARTIHTVEDVHAALDHYVACIPYERVLSTAQHISTDINFRDVSVEDLAAALAHRQQASPEDRDVYASYILEAFLSRLEQQAGRIVYQFSFGAEPLPFETGSKLRQDTIYQVAAMIARHPCLRFQVFLSSEHSNQSLCTLARELPNLSLAGYWWHNFFPGIIRKVINDRLDMLAANKQIGFFSDAYCVEWQYAKVILVRKQLAQVLAAKVEQGQYSQAEALRIAEEILYQSPQSLLGLKPSPVLE
jgi:hypothetical protein